MASVAGQFLAGVGLGAGYGVLSDYAKLGILTLKWKTRGKAESRNIISDTLQYLVDAEKSPTSGLSTQGAVDLITAFIDRTLDLAWWIDESIAMSTFVQMIHQSVAFAISASHAGSIGTVGNVYSGAASPSSARTASLNEGSNELERKERGFINASVGQNLPTLTAEVTKGINTRISDGISKLLSDCDSLVGEWNDQFYSYYRRYSTMAHARYESAIGMIEDVHTRASSIYETICNEHLKRINELLDTLDGAYYWYDSGLLGDAELSEVALRVELERQASEKVFDEYADSINSAVEDSLVDWDDYIDLAWSDLTDMETEFKNMIVAVLAPLFTDVTNFVNAIISLGDTSIEDVCAYRNQVKPTNITLRTKLEHDP